MSASVRRVAAAAAALAAVGVVVGLFLSLYTTRHLAFPVGYDTPKYIWRADLVEASGLRALADSAPPPLHVNADRPGYPVLTALLHAATGARPFDLTFVLPGVVAAIVGLGAGAFAVRVLREPSWSFPVYAIGVGASVNVALIAIGYADTLLASSILIGGATTAVLSSEGEGTAWATMLLVAGAAVVHWNFALMFLAVVGGLLVLLLPGSLAARRSGASILHTPSGRLGVVIGGSAVAGGAALAFAPAAPSAPSLGAPEFTDKIHRDVPQYRFAGLGPAAAVGAAALWAGDGLRRRGLGLALVWALAGGAAVVLLALGAAVPAHRILAFSFGIPILVAAAMVGTARLLSASGVGRALGAAIVLAGLAGVAFLGHRVWSASVPWVGADQYVQSATAGRYLESVDGDRPVIFVVDVPAEAAGAVNLPFRIIRSALPGDQVERTYVYLGNAESLLAGKPTLIPGNPSFNEVSREFFDGLRPVLGRKPIVITMRVFNRHFGDLATRFRPVTENVLVVEGPPPSHQIAEPDPPSPHSNAWLAGVTAAVLAILWISGAGWSFSLVPATPLVGAALAPAFGVAALTLGGVVAGRLGVGLRGGPGVAIVVAVTALGVGLRARRGAPSGPPSPPE